MSNCPTPTTRVDVMYRMLPYLPLFLALSTSSPFWQSRRTGLKGYRLAAYDELPRTGVPELFRTKEEFDAYVAALVQRRRDGGFELRLVGDPAVAQASDAGAARARLLHAGRGLDRDRGALPHAGAAALQQSLAQLPTSNAVSRAIVVENKWRAQRYGVHGTFVAEEGAVTVAEMLDRLIEETASTPTRSTAAPRSALPGDRGAGTSADAQLAVTRRTARTRARAGTAQTGRAHLYNNPWRNA